jgi:hypothetical protein
MSRTVWGTWANATHGSYLSRLEGLDVRIVEAEVAMTGADGTRIADAHRLITTLTDHCAQNVPAP